jgi:leader peptidase (prepilin peptidase)/N-methyltransferase
MGLEIALAALAGLLIGSFLNVCIHRLPRDLSVARPPRSYCPGCERTIAWYDNVPLLSFAWLRGRCRHCGMRIPWRYPVVELATGTAFALSVARFGVTLEGIKICLFCAILIDLIATDLEERILPDEFTLGGTLAGLAFSYFVPLPNEVSAIFAPGLAGTPWQSVFESAIGAGAVSSVIWAFATMYGRLRKMEMMGLGDVKMLAMIGAFLGLKLTLFSVVLGSLLGAVVGPPVVLALRFRVVGRWKRRWRKTAVFGPACGLVQRYQLPFGSFLGVAALAAALWVGAG